MILKKTAFSLEFAMETIKRAVASWVQSSMYELKKMASRSTSYIAYTC